MATTTDPLEDPERIRLKTGLAAMEDGFARQLVTLIYNTGIHPDCLSNRLKSKLHLENDDQLLVWRRPKTGRSIAFPVFPVESAGSLSMRPWISPFLEAFPPCRVYTITRWVLDVTSYLGVVGCSPRTLRHDAIYRWLRETRDINLVCELFGTTPQTALRYARREIALDQLRNPPAGVV